MHGDDIGDDAAVDAARRNGKIIKCLIARCCRFKAIFVPFRTRVTSLVVQNIDWLGHTRMILNADNEVSLKALVETSQKTIRLKVTHVEQILAEYPPE